MNNISRRHLTTGAAWAVPVIATAAAAPAVAASPSCQPTYPTYTLTANTVRHVGADGALGTVSFWITAAPTDPATISNLCAGATPSNDIVTFTINILRAAGGPNDFRTMALNAADANNFTAADPRSTLTKTIDPAGQGTYPVGNIDYQWVWTLNPELVYNNNAQHRTYVTISAGDGLAAGGRITNQLSINGAIQTFENEGDTIF